MFTTTLAALAGLVSGAFAAGLQQVTTGFENPTSLSFYIYVPTKLATKPPVIIVPHPCGGTPQETYSQYATGLPGYADQLGMVLIYPGTSHTCWDCSSTKSLTNGGGGDSTGLVNMVKYALDKYNGDPTKVYATGSSSGGMMTNVLLSVYPEIFAGGASFSGSSAFSCWDSETSFGGTKDPNCVATIPAASNGGPTAAGNPDASMTAEQWGKLALLGDPDFNGTRPIMSVWHGTADQVVSYAYLGVQLAQWSSVLGVEFTKNVTNDPQTGYTQMVYGDGTKLVGYSAAGVPHFVPYHAQQVLQFWGLLPASGASS